MITFSPNSLFYLYAGHEASEFKQITRGGIYKHGLTEVMCVSVYLDAWGGEVWNLKLDTDWWLPLLVFSLYTGQTEVGSHQILFSTLQHVMTQTL